MSLHHPTKEERDWFWEVNNNRPFGFPLGYSGGGIAPSSLLTGLVSYWKLDEASGTRADSVGSNNLTDNNSVGQASGKLGSAASFVAASSQFLTHSDAASLQLGAHDFTLAGWVNFTAASDGCSIIVKRGAGFEYGMPVFGGTQPQLAVAGGGVAAVAPAALGTGSWRFIAGWLDLTANTVNIQIDNGSVVSTSLGANTPTSGAGTFNIGKDPAGAGTYLNGLLDGWGIWNRVLTSDERATLYNSGTGLDYPFS